MASRQAKLFPPSRVDGREGKAGGRELLPAFLRIRTMPACVCFLVLLTVLSATALGQSSEPSTSPETTAAAPAPAPSSPPVIKLEPDVSGAVPPGQIRALLTLAEEKDLENDKRMRDYTFTERQVEHRLDGHGNVAKTEIRTSEVLEVYGEQVEKLTAKDDKPLSEEEAKKEDEKIQKIIDKRKNESDDARRKRLAKEEKERDEERQFVLEIADAFDFRLLGSEMIDGHDSWVLEGKPHPGYQPKHRDAKMLSKVEGRIWIDKAEAQWVKLEITAIDTLSFGLFLARIEKGAHVIVEQTRINDEVWLPRYVEARLDAKVLLLKTYREDLEQTFRDYKKFRTDSKITMVGETQ
jgi:hypothetical protein